MAAKQGLTAQLSQAGEDAKRAVLSRTGVTSSWFSNLNTVCTIKSAPPRSPEVLQMLATKSGWLYKRNEQHVWQARWCCVVPHTFLYYFDANIGVGPGEAPVQLPQNPTQQQQDSWNKAVQKGYGNRRQHEKRSSLYLFNQSSSSAPKVGDGANGGEADPNEDGMPAATTADSSKYASLQPAGIIDLECYTSVHRSTENDLVLELAGDDQVNPDLRAFYFCAPNYDDCETWTAALLNERHAALVDECDAYKQVCEGFAQQLQLLHGDLDQANLVASEAQDELYRVRSQHEDHRRVTWRSMEEAAEKSSKCPAMEKQKVEFRANLDTVRSQDLGVHAAVHLMLEYMRQVEAMATDLYEETLIMEDKLQQSGQVDQAKVKDLEAELKDMRSKYELEKKQWEDQLNTVSAKFVQSQKELHDVQHALNSTKMEVTMFQSQQKNKMSELQQHKKILKKEVIDLRQKLENANNELAVMKHQQDNLHMQTEQERQKTALLERYVEKIESQVKVQQNMMEMMSASGSVHGGANGSASHFDHFSSPARANVVYVRTTDDAQEENDEEDVVEGLAPPNSGRRRAALDDDNKSHVSELTEDRTQRQFEAYQRDFPPFHEVEQHKSGSRIPRSRLQITSPRGGAGPPVIIGVNSNLEKGEGSGPGKNTIDSSASVPPMGLPPRGDESKQRGANVRSGDIASSVNPRSTETGSGSNQQRPAEPISGANQRPAETSNQRTVESASTANSTSIENTPVSSEPKKMSVAERARLEADRHSTPVRVRLDSAEVVQAVEQAKRQSSGSASAPNHMPFSLIPSKAPSSGESIGSQNSMFRRMEEVLLGRTNDALTDDEDDSSSIHSTRVTDYTDATPQHQDHSEEKKMTDSPSNSHANLSLAERSEMQRAMQLKFLRQKGLIKNDSEIRAGAGASPESGASGRQSLIRQNSSLSLTRFVQGG